MKIKLLNFKVKTIKSQNGFSLIELLLYMAILSILIVALFQLLTAIFDVQLESQSTSSVSSDARYIFSRLEYDISNAESISAPAVGNQEQSFTYSDGISIYTYSLVNGDLMITASPSGEQDQINSYITSVTDVSFLRLSDNLNEVDTITVSFTLESDILRHGGMDSETFRTTIGTR